MLRIKSECGVSTLAHEKPLLASRLNNVPRRGGYPNETLTYHFLFVFQWFDMSVDGFRF